MSDITNATVIFNVGVKACVGPIFFLQGLDFLLLSSHTPFLCF